MSTPYEAGGRSAQKQRTRQALVEATRKLIAAGLTPTVDAAAEEASVSRTTAYRYFPNKSALLVASHPEVAVASMLPADPPEDPAQRLDTVVTAFTSMIVKTEAQQRTMLRLSLEPDPAERGELPLRKGRAIGWYGEALEGLHGRLSKVELRNLVVAIRATTGIESLVWMVDVAGLSRAEAVTLMRWSAQALLQRALAEPPTIGRGRASGRRSKGRPRPQVDPQHQPADRKT